MLEFTQIKYTFQREHPCTFWVLSDVDVLQNTFNRLTKEYDVQLGENVEHHNTKILWVPPDSTCGTTPLTRKSIKTIRLRPLRFSEATIVNDNWVHSRGDETLKIIQKDIASGCTVAAEVIVLTSSGEEIHLAGWTLCNTQEDEAIGKLFSSPLFRGLGIAKMLVAYMALYKYPRSLHASKPTNIDSICKDLYRIVVCSNRPRRLSQPPFAYIEDFNESSRRVFQSLGFKPVSNVSWFVLVEDGKC